VLINAAFTRRKLARASQEARMRTHTFHESYGKFDRNYEASCDFHYSPCMKRLRASPALDSCEPTFIA
jgi:hypothetical protein